MNLDAASHEAAVAQEDRDKILCTQTNACEGVKSFLEKRAPNFSDT